MDERASDESPSGCSVVTGPDGRLSLVVGRDGDELRVRQPATGRERVVAAGDCTPVEDEPLTAVRRALDTDVALGSDDRTVGLAVELVDRGATPIERLLSAY